MAKRIEVCVIGLGKFGSSLAEALREMDHAVLGIDSDMDHVRQQQAVLSQVYQADATDRRALEQLAIADLDHVVVSMGDNLGHSVLVAMNLLEMGVKSIWMKATSEEHARVLKRLGVHHVLFPEQHMARQLAHQLAVPGLLEYLPLGAGIIVREITVEKWDGMTLRDLSLPKRHEVQIVAVRREGRQGYNFVPKADDVLHKGDVLVLLGKAEDMDKLEK
jgi:trk system potassium uptake protein TrkA